MATINGSRCKPEPTYPSGLAMCQRCGITFSNRRSAVLCVDCRQVDPRWSVDDE